MRVTSMRVTWPRIVLWPTWPRDSMLDVSPSRIWLYAFGTTDGQTRMRFSWPPVATHFPWEMNCSFSLGPAMSIHISSVSGQTLQLRLLRDRRNLLCAHDLSAFVSNFVSFHCEPLVLNEMKRIFAGPYAL